MDNPGLPELLWQELDGRLWHATSPAGLAGIVAEGQIRLHGERYLGSAARKAGAVSLFDFGPTSNGDPRWLMFNNWNAWFGSHQGCRVTAWLEIDRARVAARLWDAGRTHQWWREEGEGKKFFAGVEAFHHGPVLMAAVSGCLLVDGEQRRTFLRLAPGSSWVRGVERFEAELPPPSPELGGIAKRLSAARAQRRASLASELKAKEEEGR